MPTLIVSRFGPEEERDAQTAASLLRRCGIAASVESAEHVIAWNVRVPREAYRMAREILHRAA